MKSYKAVPKHYLVKQASTPATALMARKTLEDNSDLPEGVGQYFVAPSGVDFISTGCTLLDCALGGGVACKRILNIVGDKSTGKTLQCIEISANFALRYKDGLIRYREVEAAFDRPYAGALGMPLDRVDFGDRPCYTVEDVFNDMEAFANACEPREAKPAVPGKPASDGKKAVPGIPAVKYNKGCPGLYILDSLDALSDAAELDRDFGENTYGANKAKQMSELFRRITQRLEKAGVTLIIVSQVRENIGVTFGKTTTRSGGKALDFYASQVMWLNHIGRIEKTRQNITRKVGVSVKAMIEKNKVGLPFREAEYPIIFTFGIDDVKASVDWLAKIKRMDVLGFEKDLSAEASTKAVGGYLKEINALTWEEYVSERSALNVKVTQLWREIETLFLPVRKKY